MTMILDGSAGVTFPNSTVQVSSGVVLQVVGAFYGTSTTTSGTSYVDTGLTATITPKFSTSKILVLVSHGTPLKIAGADIQFQLVRNSTSIWVFGSDSLNNGSSTGQYGTTASINYLDSPATTSATTYKTQFANGQATGSVYANIAGASITLMEIAG